MKREIKFRAWDKKENCWFKDFCIHSNGYYSDKTVEQFMQDPQGYWTDAPENMEIMQYTGLKDKNGVEIYEGDIVKVRNIKGNQLIGYDSGWLCYGFVYDTGELMRKITPREMIQMAVIGNIYQNPELLK